MEDSGMKKVLAGLAFTVLIALTALAQTASAPKSSGPIATLDGQPIYKQDLPPDAQAKLAQLRNQIYQVEREGLDRVIRERIIENAAKKQGLSTEQLLEKEADAKVAEPSEAETKGYYEAYRTKFNKPFEQVQPEVQKELKQLEIQHARQEYMDSLRAQAQVTMLLALPKIEVGYDPARVRGNASAPVTIVEFADYQCAYCGSVESTLRDLLKKYDGRVKLAYRDFPLSTIHPHAEMAAEAARCAEAQGNFWLYHDALFADQSKLDLAALEARAQRLGLNVTAFHTCVTSGQFKAAVQQDFLAGIRAGVQGTPAFFVNGEFLSGSQPEAAFARIIDRELADAGPKAPAIAAR
jgi:protein-disulfide isomerase